MTRGAASSSESAWSASDLERNPHAAADKADRVRRMFAAIARRYDLNNRLHSFGRDQAWRRRAVSLARVQPADRVLDVACGTGDLTEAFCDAVPAEVTGLDFVEAMLEIAREKSRRRRARSGRGLDCPEPAYLQGDAMALPFDDASFDVLSIAFGIRNVSDPAAALAEFRRVLRPGGRLVVLEFSRPGNAILRWLNAIYSHHIMPLTATLIARDRSGAYRYLPRSIDSFLEGEQMMRLIKDAGFGDVTQHALTFGVCSVYMGRRGLLARPV